MKIIQALAATKEGEKLVQHLGFKKIEGKKNAYVLENFKEATKPIRSFFEALETQESIPITPEKKRRSSTMF